MDNTTIAIGAISIAICAIPFVAVTRTRNKRNKELLNVLNHTAKKNNSILTHYDIQGDLIVALDSKRGFFYFLNHKTDRHDVVVYDLDKYTNTTIKKEYLDLAEGILDRVSMVFQASKLSDSCELKFYDLKKNYQPSGQIQLAEKWSGILNEVLKGSETITSKLDSKVIELID